MFVTEINYMDISDIEPSKFNNKNLNYEVNALKTIYTNLKKINHIETVKRDKYRYFFININKKKLTIQKEKKEAKILEKLKSQGKKTTIKKFDVPLYISQHTVKQKKADRIRHFRAIAAGRKMIDDFDDDDIEKILEETNIQIYKTRWSRLSESLKLNRIHKFVKFLKNKHNLTKEHSESLRKELFNAVKNRIISKSEYVEYDEDNCKILSIGCLEYNNNDNIFLFKV